MTGSAMVLAAGAAGAAVCGGCLSMALLRLRREERRRRSVRATAAATSGVTWSAMPETNGIARHMLLAMQRASRGERVRPSPVLPRFSGRFDPDEALLRHAGMEGTVTPAGFKAARIQAMLAVAGLFGLVGAVFSSDLAGIGLVAGLAFGFALPLRALRQEARTRSEDAERHLSEMLEVTVLGLRSGLSLERSLSLYPHYFDTVLSRSVARAVSDWETGLVPRDEALRNLAAQYESALLGRVVEDAIRSLRFGSPLADALESTALEARSVHKARVEERIAKAPVKMMLPVGTLILPAMLLLVMGPVVLELMTEL